MTTTHVRAHLRSHEEKDARLTREEVKIARKVADVAGDEFKLKDVAVKDVYPRGLAKSSKIFSKSLKFVKEDEQKEPWHHIKENTWVRNAPIGQGSEVITIQKTIGVDMNTMQPNGKDTFTFSTSKKYSKPRRFTNEEAAVKHATKYMKNNRTTKPHYLDLIPFQQPEFRDTGSNIPYGGDE
jgi:hypothetical protein